MAAYLRDIKRAWQIAHTKAFPCPGCGRSIPREELVVHGKRVFCPTCSAVVLAPHGQPVGYVGEAPPPPEPPPPEGGVLATLGFLAMATDGVFILYLFWMLPGILTAALIGYAGFRPIGWEQTAVTVVSLLLTLLFAAFTFPLAVLATKGIPGLLGTVVAIVIPLSAVVPFHAFIVMPWGERAGHEDNWPAGVRLVGFGVCASRFRLGTDVLSGDGRWAFEVENRGTRAIRSATFTVRTGVSSGFFEGDGLHRHTIHDVPPGGRRRVEDRGPLGRLAWRGVPGYGGPGAAAARIWWDDVRWDGGEPPETTVRPDDDVIWPVPDCPGVTRPEVPW